MRRAVESLERLRRLAQTVSPGVPPVDLALPASRALLEAAGARFKYVGGVAVVHHGYRRLTVDIDVLVDPSSLPAIATHAGAHGFVVESRSRLRHVASSVAVDLLIAGDPMPRPGNPPYPSPDSLDGAEGDPAIVALGPLWTLKLRAHRHQDLADVVALLKERDDAHYLEVEAAVAPELGPELARLRDDALEELRLSLSGTS